MPCSTIARRQGRRRVEVGEGLRRRRVGQVVGGHVDRLHRRDGTLGRRRDALLQLPHLGGERRLVADGARHPAEQRRDLGARLDEAEDVVDEEQHVLALVAEVLRHRQAREADAQARSRRLVHLAVAERDLVEHARLLISSRRSLPSRVRSPTPEKTETPPCSRRDVVDQLLDQDGLADAGAAEEADLAAAHVRRDQVDHLDAGLEDLDLRRQVGERGRVAVDRPALCVGGRRLLARRRARRGRSRRGRASRRRRAPRSARRCRRRRCRGRCRRSRPSRPRARDRRRGAAAPPRSASPPSGRGDAQRRVDLRQLARGRRRRRRRP